MTIPESIAFALAYCAIGTVFSAAYALWMGWKWPRLPIDAADRTIITLFGLFWPAAIAGAAGFALIALLSRSDWSPIRTIINLAHRKGAEMGQKP